MVAIKNKYNQATKNNLIKSTFVQIEFFLLFCYQEETVGVVGFAISKKHNDKIYLVLQQKNDI